LPWPEHSVGMSQASPPHPGTQSHWPLSASQTPWPEQSLRHSGTEQSGPEKPGLHLQMPSWVQTPWPEQCEGHAIEQSAPAKPAWHSQRPASASQRPWPEQLAGQARAVSSSRTSAHSRP
jgi:hypothetical protein